MNPPTRVCLEFFLGDEITVSSGAPCTDQSGNLLVGQPAVMRISSATTTELDVATTTDGEGNATFLITAADQVFVGGLYVYQMIAYDLAGDQFTQQFGTINFRPSLFGGTAPSPPPTPSPLPTYTIISGAYNLKAPGRYGIDTSVPSALALPAITGLIPGVTIEIVDVAGDAATNPIVVSPQGSDTLSGGVFSMAQPFGSARFIVGVGAAAWQIIT